MAERRIPTLTELSRDVRDAIIVGRITVRQGLYEFIEPSEAVEETDAFTDLRPQTAVEPTDSGYRIAA